MSKMKWFVVGCNGAAVVYSIVAWLWGGVCLLKAHEKFLQSPFFVHSFNYVPYYMSLWGTALFSVYGYFVFAINIVEIRFKMKEEKTVKILKVLKTILSYVFFSAVFPNVATTFPVFWGIYDYDRELIYPVILDEVFPFWINHAMHTVPALMLVLGLIQENAPPMKHTLPGTIGITALFIGSVYYIKQRDNKWIYFGLHFVTEEQRMRLFVLLSVVLTYTSILGTTLGKMVEGFKRSLKENWIE